MKPLNIRKPWMDLQRITVTQAALFHLFTSISLAGGQSGSGSGMVGTTSSSLFVASKDLSTSGWEQYKTESLPSEDLSQCLARCMLHQNQWWNGLHSGWVKYSYMQVSTLVFSQVQCSLLWIECLRRSSHHATPGSRFWRNPEKFSHPFRGRKVCTSVLHSDEGMFLKI